MRLAKRLTCLVLVAALTLLTPGPDAYAAMVDAAPVPEGAPAPVVPQASLAGMGVAVPDLSVKTNVEFKQIGVPQLPAATISAGERAVSAQERTPTLVDQSVYTARASAPSAARQALPGHTRYATVPAHGAAAQGRPVTAQAALAQGVENLQRASPEQAPAVLDSIYEQVRARGEDSASVSASTKSSKRTPERGDELEPSRKGGDTENGGHSPSDIDAPRHEHGDDGPDGTGGAGVFAVTAVAGATAIHLAVVALSFIPVVGSLILHEMGHAKMASILGDEGPRRAGRLSLGWQGVKSHIDPFGTIILPLAGMLTGGIPFGWAKKVETSSFHTPRDMALIGFAGPAVNIALAGVGILTAHALAGLGAPAMVLAALKLSVVANAVLAAFNLIPVFPLDGHWLLRAALQSSLARRWDRFNERAAAPVSQPKDWLRKAQPYLPLIALIVVANFTGLFAGFLAFVAHLLPAIAVVPGVAMAGAALPALAAAGLLIGQIGSAGPPLLNPGHPVNLAANGEQPTELIVMLGESSPAKLTQDLHLSNVDLSSRNGVSLYAKTQQTMLAQLSAAGITPDALASYGATPIATYKRINAATIRVDASKAAELRAALEREGHKVFDNKRRRIITPVPNNPESMDPALRSPVTMDEVLSITKTDSVHKIATERWGAPDQKPGLFRRLFGQAPAQTPIAVIDSGAATEHPLLKRVKNVVNVTSGENKDDIGHGSWVTSMVLNFAKWNRNLTHYKTFVDGSASTDDILKALTAAGNDGNLVISNSWGDDEGDPNGPDSQLVLKLAKEGHVLVFAAGNAGPGANTIGSPAIVYFDAGQDALRVVSVAAAGRDKKIAYFSSRGPRSPKTKDDETVTPRPDATAIGSNVEGAWPEELGPDRVDGAKGPLKAISGTSMSTPDVAGAISLLCMLFGVTTKGAQLDAVVRAVIETLEPTGQGRDKEGRGFLNVEAAFKKLEEVLTPKVVPSYAAREYAVLLRDERAYQARREYVNAREGRYNEDVEPKLQSLARARWARMRELEAKYPKLARRGIFR